jgi:hypothetical protein
MEGYTEQNQEQATEQEKEKCLNNYFKLALAYRMLQYKSNDAGILLFDILMNELNDMKRMVKDVDTCKANVMSYMNLHTNWQIRYADLVGNIVISNADLVKIRAKIHGISLVLYEHMPDQMVHPVYKQYIGYKNGDLYIENKKRISNMKPQSDGYIADGLLDNKSNITVPRRRHRIIIECFLQIELDSKYDIDHIDGNSSNNSILNLQIMTRLEHMKKTHCGKQSTSGLTKSKPIMRFKLDDDGNMMDEKTYTSAHKACIDSTIKCHVANIVHALKG